MANNTSATGKPGSLVSKHGWRPAQANTLRHVLSRATGDGVNGQEGKGSATAADPHACCTLRRCYEIR